MNFTEDCYLFEGGNFNGENWYWSCTLPSREACFDALHDTHNRCGAPPSENDMHPWGHSEYRVVMDGPAHYHRKLKTELWDVTSIQNGLYYERADGDRRMSFWA